jgi:hypothetical protein
MLRSCSATSSRQQSAGGTGVELRKAPQNITPCRRWRVEEGATGHSGKYGRYLKRIGDRSVDDESLHPERKTLTCLALQPTSVRVAAIVRGCLRIMYRYTAEYVYHAHVDYLYTSIGLTGHGCQATLMSTT